MRAQKLHRLVVHHAAVIDRPHAGANRRLDAIGSVRVRGDVPAPPLRLFDGDAQLLLGVLLRPGRHAFRQHGAGRQNLDEVRALLQVGAHRLPDLVRAVSEVSDDGDVDEDGELAGVARAASGRYVVAGHHQARAGHDAFVDCLAKIDIGEGPRRSHVAARREASEQRGPRVGGAVQRRLTWRRLQ